MESFGVYLALPTLFITVTHITHVSSNGRLMVPPARNSMWRYGYANPVNYDDNQLFCGGMSEMAKNNGQCGVCGDSFSLKPPRPHEIGGMYGNRIVTRKYITGEIIDVSVELTANQKGRFEFAICPQKNSRVDVTQACLDRSPVPFVLKDGRLDKYYLVKGTESKIYNLRLQLPKKMPPCRNCVLQWTYRTGNNWGTCLNGGEAMGCGPQNVFKNCADISVFDPIEDEEDEDIKMARSLFYKNSSRNKNPSLPYNKDYAIIGAAPMESFVIRGQICIGFGKHRVPEIDDWCQFNCLKYPPRCPKDKCRCITNCEAIGLFKNVTGSDLYCQDNCNIYPQKKCPKNKCLCT